MHVVRIKTPRATAACTWCHFPCTQPRHTFCCVSETTLELALKRQRDVVSGTDICLGAAVYPPFVTQELCYFCQCMLSTVYSCARLNDYLHRSIGHVSIKKKIHIRALVRTW